MEKNRGIKKRKGSLERKKRSEKEKSPQGLCQRSARLRETYYQTQKVRYMQPTVALPCLSKRITFNFSVTMISFIQFLTTSKLSTGVFHAFAVVNLVAVKQLTEVQIERVPSAMVKMFIRDMDLHSLKLMIGRVKKKQHTSTKGPPFLPSLVNVSMFCPQCFHAKLQLYALGNKATGKSYWHFTQFYLRSDLR